VPDSDMSDMSDSEGGASGMSDSDNASDVSDSDASASGMSDSDASAGDSNDEPTPRVWARVSRSEEIDISGGDSASGRKGKQKLVDLSFDGDIAEVFLDSAFGKFKKNYGTYLGEETDTTIITVMTAAKYTTENLETGALDTEHIRCDKSFMGYPWQDGVVFIQANDRANKIRTRPVVTSQTKLQLDYEPDAHRRCGIVNLISVVALCCTMLIRMSH
jgi:hypothetical protein